MVPNNGEQSDDEAAELDEACPSAPPVRLARHRPRLAILLQACKAVVGSHGRHSPSGEDEEAPAGQQQVQPSATELTGRQHVEHYESPLIAKLRQVEVRVIKSQPLSLWIA